MTKTIEIAIAIAAGAHTPTMTALTTTAEARYVANTHAAGGFGDLTPHPDDDSAVQWYKGVLPPPTAVPVCTKCSIDLRRWKAIAKRDDLKATFKYACSSHHCLWHDWFEARRPPDFAKWHHSARMRRWLGQSK